MINPTTTQVFDAHLVRPTSVRESILDISPVEPFKKAFIQKQANDYSLAKLDDSLRQSGSLLIALFAGIGATRKSDRIGAVLGVISWLFAMQATQGIVNRLVQFRTGLNLRQRYINNQGETHLLFKDPAYLPDHLLSDDLVNKVGDYMGIPANRDRRELVIEKMRQIGVQAKTWATLIAGISTPIIASAVCHVLEEPVARLVNWFKIAYPLRILSKHQWMGGADKPLHPQAVVKEMDRYVKQMVGEVEEAHLTKWWQDLGNNLVKKTGLNKAFKPGEVVYRFNQAEFLKRLETHFLDDLRKDSAKQQQLKEFIEAEQDKLKHLRAALEDRLKAFETRLKQSCKVPGSAGSVDEVKLGDWEKEQLSKARDFTQRRLTNAEATLNQYKNLFKKLKDPHTSASEIRLLIRHTNSDEVRHSMETGFTHLSNQLGGKQAAEVQDLIRRQAGVRAHQYLGASAGDHLLKALEAKMATSLWRRRVLGYVGGGLALSTFIFTQFFVGRQYKTEKNPWL